MSHSFGATRLHAWVNAGARRQDSAGLALLLAVFVEIIAVLEVDRIGHSLISALVVGAQEYS